MNYVDQSFLRDGKIPEAFSQDKSLSWPAKSLIPAALCSLAKGLLERLVSVMVGEES